MVKRCIVIGASAGGFEVLVDLVAKLPADLPAPVFVAMHIPAQHHSYLAEILSRAGPLQALHPPDGAKVEPGFIYVAPPDHHLLIDDGYVAVKKGPKENGFRPSIDALFRSAAYAYGPAAIGVVLSGALNDGTAGLWTIKRLGGTAIVQDPREARYASMPRSALEYVNADYQVQAAEIPALFTELTQAQSGESTSLENETDKELEERIATEVQIAAGDNISQRTILELGKLTPFTCPDCHGVLVEVIEGKLSRFRCHTGHGFTEDALLEAVMQSTGEIIWQATRGLQETEMLLEHIGRHIRDRGDPVGAEKFFAKAHDLERRASRFQELALDHESLSTDKLEQSANRTNFDEQ